MARYEHLSIYEKWKGAGARRLICLSAAFCRRTQRSFY